jgi:hypothetical protein
MKKLTSHPFNNTNRALLSKSCLGNRSTELLANWEKENAVKRALISVLIGFAATIVAVIVAFTLARSVDAVGIFIAPAALLVPIIGPLGPDRLAYWIEPEGGAPAGALFILSCAFLFWSLVFGAAHFSWSSWKRRRAVSH